MYNAVTTCPECTSRNAPKLPHPSPSCLGERLKTTDGTPIADAESTAESALRQTIDVLEQVMCTHDVEKLAISVLEIYEASKPYYSLYVFNFASELMTGVNGTLFLSGYGEEPVVPHECRATVTITTERANVVEAQNATRENM